MQTFDIVAIMVRWLHLSAVVVAIGGAFFMRFVLMPSAAAALSDDVRKQLHAQLMRRWARIVHVNVALLLTTGVFNVYVAIRHDVAPMPYHAILLVKIIMAFAVFFLASTLSGSRPGFAKIREKGRTWVGVLIALGAAIILLSSVLKALHVSAAA